MTHDDPDGGGDDGGRDPGDDDLGDDTGDGAPGGDRGSGGDRGHGGGEEGGEADEDGDPDETTVDVDPDRFRPSVPAEGEYVAVLDRVESGAGGDLAVLVIERDGEAVADVALDVDALPEAARHQDAVLALALRSGPTVDLRHDPEETDRRRDRAQDRFDSLARRPPSGDGGDGDGADDRDEGGDARSDRER